MTIESKNCSVAPTVRQLRHEISNNLAVISMGLQALGGVRESQSDFEEISGVMYENIESLKQQLNTMLDLSESAAAAEDVDPL